MKIYPWIWKWFLVWYVVGVVLVGFDLLPNWLEWANPVFLWLAGLIGGFVISDGIRHARFIVPFIFFGSIAVETLGVKTGFPFSEYVYAEAFGPTVFGVPVTIGAAWLAVIGASFAVARLFTFNRRTLWLVPFLAVWLDMAIDPVAANVKGYWEWANGGLYYDIPTQNFVGWFGLSLLFSWLLDRFEVEAEPTFLMHGRYLFVMLHALFGVTAVNAGLYGIGVLSLVTACVIYLERRLRHDRSEQKKWFSNVFSTFVKERQIRPSFHTINVRADDVPTPGLFLSTHSSWWDGLILLMLNEYYLRHDIHVLMDEEGLRRFPFFRHLGAFSIKKGKLSDIRASLAYANKLLTEGKSVWLFPQGREYPQEHRPLEIGTGATMLLSNPTVQLCAIYYTFASHASPVVYVRFRTYTVVSMTRREQKQEIAAALELLYDDTRDDVISQSERYISLFPPKRGLADWTEQLLKFRRGHQ